ncbi:hormogonium polysaccharide biosynthesis protein HpsA [Nostoc sp. UHCC 0870]|uniref:hormogonium polysaccharide biosynthesis protein HpsA n=1 Tax=Nostoc sp. UHCC 0870 TaxID=2914041 RepID=UPI001EDD18EB|nr:hormogonium polysaccharide biosynthesis protein HpsA [Nostoc sp. UHCC 0870]UKO97151.1 hormogonium polysaccharide biosynthesis protein HpsA [Nostoc sp. UHCC 0870]
MSPKRQLFKGKKKLLQRLLKKFLSAINKPIIWLLRNLFVNKKRRTENAGFVLPTVVMVSLVVVLLTTAILFRSFERSKNASNVRVNETVLRAATPALDRAKAKVEQLFLDPRLPRATPSDVSLYQVISDNINEFTFGDEIQLKIVSDFNGTSGIQEDEETLKTAWKYPVDTDNDGKFDSYTIYGIYFKTPTATRARSPLEARTQPMDEGATSQRCQSDIATSANLVGSQGWYKVGSKLKRSIFVYTATIPITELGTGLDSNKYEVFSGNKGFVALEYQQDRERIPLANNAVIYEDDLEITPGAAFDLNGRIFTNGNFMTRGSNIRFYLVSSPKSCYYTEDNSKIVVAGNVINSRVNETSGGSNVRVDLFDKAYNVDTITSPTSDNISNTNKTVPTATHGNTGAYNDEAYAKRIDRLVAATEAGLTASTPLNLPKEVQEAINRSLAADASLNLVDVRKEQLKIYFRKRTRRVPLNEIGFGNDGLVYKFNSVDYDYLTNSPLQGDGDSLRPVDLWVFPFAPSDGKTATDYTGIAINENGTTRIYLPATEPVTQSKAGKESRLGDRILVGNNMPQFWYDTTKNAFLSSPEEGQLISGREWDDSTTANKKPRKRFSQAYQLDDLGITNRDDFWEKSAAQKPNGTLDVVGGLRVITGAGIYLPNDYDKTAKTFTNTIKTVWADSMAMGVTNKDQGLPDDKTPYLQMRATAVYHYKDGFYDPTKPSDYQTPIACVSSYYDPTSETTAKNLVGLPDFAAFADPGRALTGLSNITTGNGGSSNNGVVYSASSLAITGYRDVLDYQAALKYPSGRLVNEPIKNALEKIDASKNLTLSEQSAVDSAMCALKILDGTISSPTDTAIPHGAIMETAFLDARQIKAVDQVTGSRKYDVELGFRQPLEIRATVLDLDLLRRTSKTGGEFLLPNSGIIYATRDDALADQSDATSPDVSATDFKLDPTRRPNGIMLINGSDLSRNATYKAEEKGLIVASNLPVYIKGDFNKHTKEEFTESNTWGNDFYKRKTLDPNFACRQGQFTSCSTGETWRSATVIADAITVLSDNFRLGFREDGDYGLRDNYGNYALGYDLNNDNDATDNVQLNETFVKFDINNDGAITDTNVDINESNITATVAARLNGFWDNNFVTSRNITDSQYRSTGNTNPLIRSSYLNNFVTPIQRRITFSEYVMEICPKLTVTACKPGDWVVGYDFNGNGSFGDTNTYNGVSYSENQIKANQLLKALADYQIELTAFKAANSTATYPNSQFASSTYTFNRASLWAGTTATSAATDSSDAALQRYPRRVAFLRYGNSLTVTKQDSTALKNVPSSPVDDKLVLDDNYAPVPLGLYGSGTASSPLQVRYYPFLDPLKINSVDYEKYSSSDATKRPRTQSNTLWFRTKDESTSPPTIYYDPKYPLNIENTLTGTRTAEQPLLVPVLQLQYPTNTSTTSLNSTGDAMSSHWMQRAVETETNLVFAQGNAPERPSSTGNTGEYNGGLENFVRYLETWDLGSTNLKHKALGSFIQFKRSNYATAPWQPVIADPAGTGTIFAYPQRYQSATGNLGRTPFYAAPSRSWGYDVALLTQLPDLFSQRFTAPSTNDPNEFYREVGRDDTWVKTLLCAAQVSSVSGGYETAPSASYGSEQKYAISPDQRPLTGCP